MLLMALGGRRACRNFYGEKYNKKHLDSDGFGFIDTFDRFYRVGRWGNGFCSENI